MVLEIVPGALSVLGGLIEADGRVSWIPSSIRGYQPANCYLLLEENGGGPAEGLIVDPGPAFHADLVHDQLVEAVPGDCRVSVLMTRSEADSVGSLGAVATAVPIAAYYAGGTGNPFDGYDDTRVSGRTATASFVRLTRIPAGFTISLGDDRTVELIRPPLRLLATYWAYDSRTRTLFTSDSFTHALVRTPDEPRVVDRVDDPRATLETVRAHLLTKLQWLGDLSAGKDVVLGALEAIFEEREIEIVAPDYGCVLVGREVVERHYELLAEAIRKGAQA
jgi:flavorubredoxin